MTVEEFSNEFDSLTNQYGIFLDEYEKSVLLTEAQYKLVVSYFKDFEKNSKIRTDLKELIKNYNSTTIIESNNNISKNSKFFKIPNDVLFIIQESCVLESIDDCLNGKVIKVIPKTHDEYNIQIDNPFKTPNNDIAWRLDFYKQNKIDNNVEIINPTNISQYNIRYISYPKPILLTNLSNKINGEGLSIEGETNFQTSLLNQSLHREILNTAVSLSMSNYKK